MKKVNIDGRYISSYKELHELLKKKLEFPDFYGANLDALWDCITGMIELPLELRWKHYEVSEERLGEKAQRTRAVLEEAHNQNIGFVFIVEEEARR
jgi:ribonuclease inhibitor